MRTSRRSPSSSCTRTASPEHELRAWRDPPGGMPGLVRHHEPRAVARVSRVRAHLDGRGQRLRRAHRERLSNGLERNLHADGFRGSADHAVQRRTVGPVDWRAQQCIQMLESGPAGGRGRHDGAVRGAGVEHAIAFDMGGTTAKACVVMRGEPSLSPDYFIGGYNEGLAIRISGAGHRRGRHRWRQRGVAGRGGALHVGPRSAGAEPGRLLRSRRPEPTVTDANVVLGRLAPDAFSAARCNWTRGGGRAACAHAWRSRSDVDLERAASGMLEVATSRWPTWCAR